MTHRRHSTDSARRRIFAGLAALGILACLAAAALMAMGVLPRSTGRMILFLGGAAAVVLALLRLVLAIAARRAEADLIAPPSELTTLTFPPSVHFDRPRLQRADWRAPARTRG